MLKGFRWLFLGVFGIHCMGRRVRHDVHGKNYNWIILFVICECNKMLRRNNNLIKIAKEGVGCRKVSESNKLLTPKNYHGRVAQRAATDSYS